MKITFEDIATTIFFGVIFLIMGWAMMTAAEKERELGIDGMSSERILAKEEMENHQGNYTLQPTGGMYKKKSKKDY